MPEQNAPRVFLCHATEDNERFALPFATALRANGANAWIDTWEIKAGDSLVIRIFTEGLGNADAVIPILSPTSITKPWVQAELDIAIVRKINGQTRLMPLLLELPKEDVPVALQATSWINVPNPTNLNAAVDEALRAIFNTNNAPPLGSPPPYAIPTIHVPGLTPIDQEVLVLLCVTAQEDDGIIIGPDEARDRATTKGISTDAFEEALQVLNDQGYLRLQRGMGGHVMNMKLAPRAIELALTMTMSEYPDLKKRLIARITNNTHGSHQSNETLAEELGTTPWIASHVLRHLQEQGLIKTSPVYMGREVLSIYQVSPLLKRTLE